MLPDDSDLVWSSDQGDLRKESGSGNGRSGRKRGGGKSKPGPRPAVKPGGSLKVRREVSGRKGKTVTTVSGIPLGDAEVKKLATKLKKRCGVGGTARNGVIEIQGDHREKVISLLEADGFKAVAAGG